MSIYVRVVTQRDSAVLGWMEHRLLPLQYFRFLHSSMYTMAHNLRNKAILEEGTAKIRLRNGPRNVKCKKTRPTLHFFRAEEMSVTSILRLCFVLMHFQRGGFKQNNVGISQCNTVITIDYALNAFSHSLISANLVI